MRIFLACMTAAAVVGTGLVAGGPAGAASGGSAVVQTPTDYIVLHAVDSGAEETKAAIKAAGGTVVSANGDLGYVVARSSSAGFVKQVDAAPAVIGAARNRVIGEAPAEKQASKDSIEKMISLAGKAKGTSRHGGGTVTAEPLADLQWDMKMIDATATGSYAKQKGSKKVLVGVIDTGIDGTHPDIAPNFDANLSRNFTTDMPDIDGPCEVASCVDPANVDDDGHGTHVASTIGSPINGLGMAGVAPNVTLVNIRAGQDSGYFFLKSTLDALTYAGKIGVDVVNMSYYTDPWLYNCVDNPADSPAEQLEQKVIREATQRALNFARGHGVLPIAAEGNEATDLGNPTSDATSPDYPVDAAKERVIDNSCLNVPAESKGVVTVSSVGRSTRKAYYSNYGTEQTDVAAPGGDAYEGPDGTRDITGTILAAYPTNVAQAAGVLNPDGTPNTTAVVQSCKGTVCGYYQYIQGTSMAAPHAVGVASLIVSQYGYRDFHNGGLGLAPSLTEAKLLKSAVEHACPTPRTYHYKRILLSGAVVEADHTCEGPKYKNGFYGRGIVNAKAAVS
ncbi:MAG TPA: S8 family serine peptidase [Kineosporiaceae bacterium]|nr:S8 family serine peptidase [Kineosporiaceae bacterium]